MQVSTSKYKRLFRNDPVEWCELMSGSSKSNRLLMALLDSIKKTNSKFFHNCPYTGRHELINLTLTKPFIDIIPTGSYKISYIFNVTKPSVCTFTLVTQVKII